MAGINNEILNSEIFTEMRNNILAQFDQLAFPSINFEKCQLDIDWDLALFLASALEKDGEVSTQQAIMEVAFGALQSNSSTSENKVSAALLLERFGNWPSITLATKRDQISEHYQKNLPLPLRIDSTVAKIEHRIRPLVGDSFFASDFQRRFWQKANSSNWLSVSAPTSAGKSHIIRRWIIDQTIANDHAVVLYVVPTRALVDEVSKELLEEQELKSVYVHTIPWDTNLSSKGSRILVMTQERVQITFNQLPSLKPTAIFLDEAQKVGDGYRGILLEEILQESVRRNPSLKAVFASPMTENPDALLSRSKDGNKDFFISSLPSVKQNLYWVNPIPGYPLKWTIGRAEDGKIETVAEFFLDKKITSDQQRLSVLPVKLSSNNALNIIYANTPSNAEKYANAIFDLLGPDAEVKDTRICDLQDLIQKSVYPEYLLSKVISRGVAFHYGNMPQLVRQGVEELYRAGLIRFLVCTSTLLEGVNLPCTNIWIMNPRRGRSNPMTPFDFWNLAGRAGRWGAEFAGNIICIATGKWKNPAPTRRSSGHIVFATEEKLKDFQGVIDFVNSGGDHNGRIDEDLEALAAHLFDASFRGESSLSLRSLLAESPGAATAVMEAFKLKEAEIKVPEQIRRAHPSINPQSMQRLLDDLQGKDPSSFKLPSLRDEDAFEKVITALARCERNMNAGFGSDRNRRRLTYLLLSWMKGHPIPRIIENRIEYEKKSKPNNYNLASCIRSVLEDIEQIARFRAPKYLACYADIAKLLSPDESYGYDGSDMMKMLELGVSRITDVSLMSLGLSRAAAIQISSFIAGDELTADQAFSWLCENDLDSLGIPALILREIKDMKRRFERRDNLSDL
jgi:helicase-like:DEAD/DEAH box helicase-like